MVNNNPDQILQGTASVLVIQGLYVFEPLYEGQSITVKSEMGVLNRAQWSVGVKNCGIMSTGWAYRFFNVASLYHQEEFVRRLIKMQSKGLIYA